MVKGNNIRRLNLKEMTKEREKKTRSCSDKDPLNPYGYK